jgi:hypothetical protein
MIAFWDVSPWSLVKLTVATVRTSETSVYFNESTRRYIPEGCHLHNRRSENLKSHTFISYLCVVIICSCKGQISITASAS